MANVLLVEPDYRSKFPPLGLFRLSTYHKNKGDCVTFVRGKVPALRETPWHRVYVASLFTWELPRTVDTVRYYLRAVDDPQHIIVGGIGATLKPDFIRQNVQCRVIEGQIDRRGMLEPGAPAISGLIPDYSLLGATQQRYEPSSAFFCRTTMGCVRKCCFCAVPKLEPEYRTVNGWRSQIKQVRSEFGEQRNLVILDNNVLACDDVSEIIAGIKDEGFTPGTKLNNRLRCVDFNQGIDARFITAATAKQLASICLSPVRLAFDYDGVEHAYRRAVGLLAGHGFDEFTNYVLYNYNDDPASLYRRMSINLDLSEKHGVRVTGFPMRYIPTDHVKRGYVSPRWHWRYLRGVQCVLLATHGIVSPGREFFNAAFGSDYHQFLEILSMPDRYIVFREEYKNDAADWRRRFRGLTAETKRELLGALECIHRARGDERRLQLRSHRRFRELLEHYYPKGQTPRGAVGNKGA